MYAIMGELQNGCNDLLAVKLTLCEAKTYFDSKVQFYSYHVARKAIVQSYGGTPSRRQERILEKHIYTILSIYNIDQNGEPDESFAVARFNLNKLYNELRKKLKGGKNGIRKGNKNKG